MRIRRLDIFGFKSFMDRSTFVFDEGITGVVGPNGCGKSNVVDAIRWVMGEQSAKHLRGQSMEDVIFNGSESHSPMDMGEVHLTFLNDGSAILPAQYASFSEITVSRRLFRSGESEYLINKVPCRLLDVTELFLGTGVGTKAYSIIEQGRIGLIVSSKPEDRRSLIDEAAGVTKYKLRRKAAERKMEYTEQNLLRLGDIIGELEKRLDQLQRQAKKAEKYRALKSEMKEIDLHLGSLRFLELTASARASRGLLEVLGEEERSATAQVHAEEETLSGARAELVEEERRLTDQTERLFGLENQVKVDDANLEFFARESEEIRGRSASGEAESARLTQQLEETDLRLVQSQREAEELLSVVASDHAALVETEEHAGQVQGSIAIASQQLELERNGLVEAITRVAQHRNNVSNLERQRLELQGRIARLEGELAEHQARVTSLEQFHQELTQTLAGTRQSRLSLEEQRGASEVALVDSRSRMAQSDRSLSELREELGEKRARLSSLVEIARNYEGYDRGVRAVMTRMGAASAGEGQAVLGLISDLVTVPPELERAIEAALGQRLQCVVVERPSDAAELIAHLRRGEEGRGSFIPLEKSASASFDLPQPDLTFEGASGRAIDQVRYEPRHSAAVHALLGSVILVKDLASAMAGAARNPASFTFVTLDGEVVDDRGVITGGTLEGPGLGALQKKREIQELADEVGRLESSSAVATHEHQLLVRRASELEAELRGLTQQGHEQALHLVNQEKDLARTGEDLSQLKVRVDSVTADLGAMRDTEAGLAREHADSADHSAAGETERGLREARVSAVSMEMEDLRTRADHLGANLTALRVKAASSAERRTAAERSALELAATREDLRLRLEKLSQDRVAGERRLSELATERASAVEERERLSTEASHLHRELAERRGLHTARQADVAKREVTLRDLRKRLEEVASSRGEHALSEREKTLEVTHLLQQMRDRYALELGEELHRFHMTPHPGAEVEERLATLRAQVDRMGEINLTAIEECTEISQRFEFLSTQKRDLESSLTQLRTAIDRIDRTSQERFKETFELVDHKFRQIFPRLFSGGRASLQLVEDPTTHELGVEILAQPPGKSLKTVNLLSGGEKALTAVSLIFAIFLIKPTPFCLLDEVDAPLDDANVGRYNDLIKEMSNQSQFILITHNKRTMGIVDTLYGVTMEEPGVSKLVSVRLAESSTRTTTHAA